MDLNKNTSVISGILTTFSGKVGNTPEYYKIGPPTTIDTFLGLWADGKPVSTLVNTGDYTILTKSAGIDGKSESILDKLDHSDMVVTKPAIQKILDKLDICPCNIVEGKKTIFSPSLLLTLLSPADIEVISPSGKSFTTDEKIIFIENPESGNYTIKITGTGTGSYRLLIGKFGNTDTWEEISGNTSTGKIETYHLLLNPNITDNISIDDPTGKIHLISAKNNINSIKGNYSTKILQSIINNIDNALANIDKDLSKTSKSIKSSKTVISSSRKTYKDTYFVQNTSLALLDLSYADAIINQNRRVTMTINIARNRIEKAKGQHTVTGKLLNQKISKKLAIKANAISYQLGEEILDKADNYFKNGYFYYSTSFSDLADTYFKETVTN